MIPVTSSIQLDERDLEERFVRAAGPGGQNVNKVSSAVELRFVLRGYTHLAEDVRARLARLAGRRLSGEGVIVIQAQTHRTQERNRAEALQRLIDLIVRVAQRPKIRRPTRPSAAARKRRLESKSRRSQTKTMRARPASDD